MYNFVPSVSDVFLKELITEIDDDSIRGIVLGGSHARGDATPYSDVDLACFVPDTFRPLRKQYLYREGYLISIGLKTLEAISRAFHMGTFTQRSNRIRQSYPHF